MIQDVLSKEYGGSLSSIFGSIEKQYAIAEEEDDDDPILPELRILDYRYIRFCFHPLKDRFVLNNGWIDPMWTDVKSIRAGIDGDEKEMRELVFGKNLIDIQQKSMPQLLVDEVGSLLMIIKAYTNLCRRFTLSMFFRLPAWSCGPWMNTTTMPHAFSLFPSLALPPPFLKLVP